MLRQRHAADTTLDPARVADVAAASSSSSTVKSQSPNVRKRIAGEKKMDLEAERRPLLAGDDADDGGANTSQPTSWSRRNQWILLALASGGCAAFNGVFAKLTTTELTSKFAQGIGSTLGLSAFEKILEVIIRCIFFALNLVFNGIMWSLFTTALARGHSTTQVSIMNTSSNFVITAILGFAIFSESLPPLWWVGAAMLIAGNVIIGRKDESDKPTNGDEGGEADLGAALQSYNVTVDDISDSYQRLLDTEVIPPRVEKMTGIDDDEDILDLGDIAEDELA